MKLPKCGYCKRWIAQQSELKTKGVGQGVEFYHWDHHPDFEIEIVEELGASGSLRETLNRSIRMLQHSLEEFMKAEEEGKKGQRNRHFKRVNADVRLVGVSHQKWANAFQQDLNVITAEANELKARGIENGPLIEALMNRVKHIAMQLPPKYRTVKFDSPPPAFTSGQ